MGTSLFGWNTEEITRGNLLPRPERPALGGNCCQRISSHVPFSPGKAEFPLEVLVQYAETNIWSWITGILFFYFWCLLSNHSLRNVKLLQHFIDPYTGQTLPTTKTNICQKQFRLLDIEVERAKDHGFIEVIFSSTLSSQYQVILASVLISLFLHSPLCIAGWCSTSWVRLWIIQEKRRMILFLDLPNIRFQRWSRLVKVWLYFRDILSGRDELWYKWVSWPRPRAGKKTVQHWKLLSMYRPLISDHDGETRYFDLQGNAVFRPWQRDRQWKQRKETSWRGQRHPS